jgi:hypothetical protein
MNTAYIYRDKSDSQGTLGIFSFPSLGFSSYVIELPYKDNKPRVSSVPADEYNCKIRYSPKYGWTFHLTDVKGRTYILMHPGNVAGDTSKGFKTHSLGCILFGKKYGKLWGQKSVFNSRSTFNQFMRLAKENDINEFKLIIQ